MGQSKPAPEQRFLRDQKWAAVGLRMPVAAALRGNLLKHQKASSPLMVRVNAATKCSNGSAHIQIVIAARKYSIVSCPTCCCSGVMLKPGARLLGASGPCPSPPRRSASGRHPTPAHCIAAARGFAIVGGVGANINDGAPLLHGAAWISRWVRRLTTIARARMARSAFKSGDGIAQRAHIGPIEWALRQDRPGDRWKRTPPHR